MKKLSYLLILSGLVSVPAIAADAPASPHTLTGNFGITTDYIFRGVSQSQHKPAVSGGIDYSHASGLYAGTWLSNQSWVNAGGFMTNSSLEMDVYGGYKGSIGDAGYDVGLIRYQYPGDQVAGATTPNTTEAYLGASWKFLSLKYSHVVSNYFIGWGGPGGLGVSANQKTRGSGYLDLSANYDLGDGWGLIAHVGHQSVKNYGDASYTDWKLGVSKDVGFGAVTLAYTDTDGNLKDAGANPVYIFGGKKVAEGRLALSFSKSF
jgi:uncharacterized protein (TIGR02001 family)